MKNIEHLCRICVRESQFFKHIFSQGGTDDSVCKIINELCDLSIKETDGLPEHICRECYGKLVELQKFKKMCHDGSTALLSLKTKYSQVKNEDQIYQKKPLKASKSSGSPSPKKARKQQAAAAAARAKTPRGESEKQAPMNEVVVKAEPVDDDAIESTGEGEVINPEEMELQSPDSSGAGKRVRRKDSSPPSKTMNGRGSPGAGVSTNPGTLQSGQSKPPVDGAGKLKVRSQHFLMKSTPVAGANPVPPQFAIKQKALVLTNPSGIQGNVFLQPMGPNNFMPLMLANQPMILLQSPGNPGVLQAAYIKPNVFPANVQAQNTTKLPTANAHIPQPTILALQPQNVDNLQKMRKIVLQRVNNPVLRGGGVLAKPPVSTSDDGTVERVGDEGVSEQCGDVENGSEGERTDDAMEGQLGEEFPEPLEETDMGVSFLCKTVSSEHRPHVCETCGKCFRRRLHLRYHRSTHQDERPFACAECGKSFKLKTILTTHMMTHSREPPRFACNLCEKRFPTKARLKYHQVVHSSERNFECCTCQKRYKTKNQLSVHLRTHLVRQPQFPCPRCNMTFKQRMGLRKHQERLNH
ncbi:zinc finger protein 282-like [Ischnura elegans]|uniref:zinc finger protein 282-like n=1 Tax=Ischnura elegans TaxID=197161 RepID=UPI001ED874E6|nr:zinc finger protein 282-like [Ischnura elegans]